MKKSIAVSYSIYLIALCVFLFANITFDFLGAVNFSFMANFFDIYIMVFMLIFCFIILAFTQLLKPLADSFLFMFKSSTYSFGQYKQCMLSIKTTMISSLIGGGIYGIATIINMLSTLSNDFSSVGIYIALALLPIFYSLVVCSVLLPIYILLNKEIMNYKNSNTHRKSRKSQ